MKQLEYRQYGGPEVLEWADVPIPVPAGDDVVVAVKASALNPTDTKKRTGELKMLALGQRFPRGMGMEFAGVVHQVGPDCHQFNVGDKVMGISRRGNAFADFTVAKATNLHHIPGTLTMAEASCLPFSAATAHAAARKLHPERGLDVLINGGTGGISSFIVQFSASMGDRITATASADNLGLLKALGAVNALDYRSLDKRMLAGQFDIVLDASGLMKFAQARQYLKQPGVFYTLTPDLSLILRQLGTSLASRKAKALLVFPNRDSILDSIRRASNGSLRVVIGAERPMTTAIETVFEVESKLLRVPGKVVLTAE